MRTPLPKVPAGAPRSGTALGRALGRALLSIGGWQVSGALPDRPKLVVIVAPHSSYWDALWGLAAKLALGVRVGFMIKREIFGGPVGWLLRRLGALPVDRRSPGGIVREMAQRFHDCDGLWMGIAPEGTRRPVETWKSGFWRIAREAGVPVFCCYLDYPSRTLGLGPVFEPSDDFDADVARFKAFYAPFRGRHRGV